MSGVLDHMAWNALEASLLAAAILLVTRLRSPSAPVRHALWLLVAVKLLLPPVGIPGAALRDGLRSVAAGIAERPAASVLPGAPVDGPAILESVFPAAVEEDATLLLPEEDVAMEYAGAAAPGVAAESPAATAAPPALPALPASPPVDLESAAAALWLAGMAIILCRRARRVLALRALFRLSGEAPADVLDECAALAARLGIRESPRVLVAPWAPSPFLSAAGAPAIVLPACLLEPTGRGALQAVLAHELGHLKRRDHWASWVDLLATTVFWWLPTAWIAGRAMERASDEAADACAARALGSRRTYAASLVETLEVLTWNQAPFAIPGRGLGEKEAIERRLVMVLRHPLFTGLSLRSRIALVALGLFVLPAAPGPAPGQSAATAGPAAAEPEAPALPAILPRAADAAPEAAAAASADSAPAALPSPQAAPDSAGPSADDAPAALPAGSANSTHGLAGRGDSGLTSPDGAPRGFEERLSAVEKKVDRLLREMEKLTGAMAPGRYAPPPAAAGPLDDHGDALSPVHAPRPTTPRAQAGRSTRTGKGPAIAQPRQATAPVTSGQAQRLKAIERRFEERARALRKELAALEAALEEEMRAAVEDDPDHGDPYALPEAAGEVPQHRNAPGAILAPRPPRVINAPGDVTPVAPPQPARPQPAQPPQPAPARN